MLLAAIALIGLPHPARAAPPQRVVSLNVCVDQILLDLIPHDRIAAVTHLAADPLSAAQPERARGIPTTKGAAEDVLARDPDLVLAGRYSTPATVTLLRRLGRRVEVVAQPQSIDGVRDLIRDLARHLETPIAGAALIAEMDARINAARRDPGPSPPTALVYQVNNYVSAGGSLIDEALAVAGFRNHAARVDPGRNGQVGLEALLNARPDLLVLATGPATYRTAVADNLRHPALRELAQTTRTAVVPWPLWLCATHHIATAVERLAALRP